MVLVAKSFQEWEQIGETYLKSGRLYIDVKNPTSGKTKAVRVYTDSEYARMYPEAKVDKSALDPYYKPQKVVLGFTQGYITIFKGPVEDYEDWFKASAARKTVWWGWYFTSDDPIPADLPSELAPVRINWEMVGKADGTVKSQSEIDAAIGSLLYEDTGSRYQGEVGQTITVEDAEVIKNILVEGFKGAPSHFHVFRSAAGNTFIWATAAKDWPVGSVHTIRGSVKDHKLWKGEEQTILTRCREI
jgi:hypothetical protein